VGQHSRNTCS